MHWVFSVKAVTDELLHHWSRLPSLSYLRPGGDTQEVALLVLSATADMLSPLATSRFAAFTVAVKAVSQLVPHDHPDGTVA